MRLNDIPQIAQLSTPEKILLVEDLWESITFDEPSLPVPESHKKELDIRLRGHQSQPGDLLSLAELQGRIERRK